MVGWVVGWWVGGWVVGMGGAEVELRVGGWGRQEGGAAASSVQVAPPRNWGRTACRRHRRTPLIRCHSHATPCGPASPPRSAHLRQRVVLQQQLHRRPRQQRAVHLSACHQHAPPPLCQLLRGRDARGRHKAGVGGSGGGRHVAGEREDRIERGGLPVPHAQRGGAQHCTARQGPAGAGSRGHVLTRHPLLSRLLVDGGVHQELDPQKIVGPTRRGQQVGVRVGAARGTW